MLWLTTLGKPLTVEIHHFSADNVGQTVPPNSSCLLLGFAHVVSCTLVEKVAHVTTWAERAKTCSTHVVSCATLGKTQLRNILPKVARTSLQLVAHLTTWAEHAFTRSAHVVSCAKSSSKMFSKICASDNVAWTFWARVVSCATSQCTCEGVLRRRGSMHMWCLHGIGRELWERVLPFT